MKAKIVLYNCECGMREQKIINGKVCYCDRCGKKVKDFVVLKEWKTKKRRK